MVFFGLTAFIVAHFLLQDFPNTEFYLALLLISFMVLLGLKYYHRDKELFVDFDEDLNVGSWLWIAVGTFAVFVVSSFFVKAFAESSIYVPSFQYGIVYLQQFQLPPYFNDVLFNIVLVAPAEELSKLVTMQVLYLFMYKGASRSHSWGIKEAVAVGVPVGIWSILHVYRNPAYIGNLMLVVSAFIAGLIIFAVLYKTKSILAAILCHGFYNSLVIFLIYVGVLLVPVT